jgi:PAS domain S-box-containing protein
MIDNKEYRILIIEDNVGDYVLVEDFLFEQIAAPVITHAKTYKEASEILSSSCDFDVVLLDLSLPDKTGESLIEQVLACSNNIPIIVLTGYTDFDFGVKSLALGVSDYILKDELTAISLYKSIIYSSERKKATRDLLESEKRYSDLFHLSPLPMWVADLNTLEFLDVNAATLKHYGYTRNEFLSLTLKDIRPAKEVPTLIKMVAEGRKNPDQPASRLVVHKKSNGDLMNVELQIAPILYKDRAASIVIATDITERLNYIKAIEDQNERLKEISWIQSHIIRAPLSRIMGLVPLISDNEDPADREEMLGYLMLSANELDEVIKGITEKAHKADYQFPSNDLG